MGGVAADVVGKGDVDDVQQQRDGADGARLLAEKCAERLVRNDGAAGAAHVVGEVDVERCGVRLEGEQGRDGQPADIGGKRIESFPHLRMDRLVAFVAGMLDIDGAEPLHEAIAGEAVQVLHFPGLDAAEAPKRSAH